MKKSAGLLLLFLLTSSLLRAEESIFVPTPGLTPGQTFRFEIRPASPDVLVVGIVVVFKHVTPKKEEERDQQPVIPLRKAPVTAFWDKPSGQLGPFKLTLGQPAPKDMFGSPPLLAVLSKRF